MNTPTPQTSRNETPTSCAAPDCANPLTHHPNGRPARYCSPACRVRHHRQRQRVTPDPITVEVDMGSANSRGRPPGRAWLVRLQHADRSVIIAIGLRRHAADRLAEQLTDLFTNTQEEETTTLTAGESCGRPRGTSLTVHGDNHRPPTGRSH